MKIPGHFTSGARWSHPLDNYNDNQLLNIGKIAILYNECEVHLHEIVWTVIDYQADKLHITSRINGTDGLIEIFLQAFRSVKISEDVRKVREVVERSLKSDGFNRAKTWRDLVVHSVIWDRRLKVSKSRGRQGKTQNVWVSATALEWLQNYMAALEREMWAMDEYVYFLVRKRPRFIFHDLETESSEQALQERFSAYQRYQTDRLSLLPAPEYRDPHQPG